jgi:hypothetical protein
VVKLVTTSNPTANVVFQEVGEALKNKIGSTVKREDLWVTSKLWNVYHKEADVVPALQQTLKVLVGLAPCSSCANCECSHLTRTFNPCPGFGAGLCGPVPDPLAACICLGAGPVPQRRGWQCPLRLRNQLHRNMERYSAVFKN